MKLTIKPARTPGHFVIDDGAGRELAVCHCCGKPFTTAEAAHAVITRIADSTIKIDADMDAQFRPAPAAPF